jgi:hypothetical protein
MFRVFMVFVFAVNAHAKIEKFDFKEGKVRFDLPTTWQAARNFFGVPLMLLGPQKGDRRPVISVVPTGIAGVSFDSASLKKDQEGYKKGRENWLTKLGGKSVEYYPYQNPKWKNTEEVHTIGYRYAVGEKEFSEMSYYVVCGGRLFQFKTVLSKTHEKIYSSVVDGIMRSFSCK